MYFEQVRLSACNNLPSIWRHLCRAFMAQLVSVSGQAGDWLAQCEDGRRFTARSSCVLFGADLPSLLQLVNQDLGPYQVTSGQLSDLPSTTSLAPSRIALNYSGGYLTPVIEGRQYLGAGFDPTGDTAVTAAGHLHNLELMPSELWIWLVILQLAGPHITSVGLSRQIAFGRAAYAGCVCGVSGARLTLASLIGKSCPPDYGTRTAVAVASDHVRSESTTIF